MRYNPFNPQAPARPQVFVGREPEIIEFEKYLSQTIHGSPMNMSINGNRGMGKTSLLVKFEEIAKKEKCLVLRISNYEGNVTNILELADYISVNLKREILVTKKFGSEYEKFKQYAASISPTIGFGEVSLKIEREQIVQDMFRIRLLKLWDEMKGHFKAAVILIDEAESLERIEGAIIFLREVFQRISGDSNYMVVLAGKLNFPEKMSESFSPLNRFFPCSTLVPFNQSEIETYSTNQLSSVGVKIEKSALNQICHITEGHPYVLVAYCYMVFDSLPESEILITKNHLDVIECKIRARLAQDFFNPMYHPLTPKAKLVLQKIVVNATRLDFMFSDAVKWNKLKNNQISPYISELMRKGVIYKLERGKYQFFHGLFVEYVKELMHKPDGCF